MRVARGSVSDCVNVAVARQLIDDWARVERVGGDGEELMVQAGTAGLQLVTLAVLREEQYVRKELVRRTQFFNEIYFSPHCPKTRLFYSPVGNILFGRENIFL